MSNSNHFPFALVLCFLCGLPLFSTGQEADTMANHLEKARYHLEEFHKVVNQFIPLPETLIRTKRDQRRAWEILKTNFLYSPLLDFCNRIQDFSNLIKNMSDEDLNMTNDSSTATTTPFATTDVPTALNATTDITQASNTTTGRASTPPPTTTTTTDTKLTSTATVEINNKKPDDESWEEPEVRPIQIDAVADRYFIHLLFHVNHSAPVEVTRLAAFDVEKSVLPKASNSPRTIQSLTRFSKIETSPYCETGYEVDNLFSFESQSQSGNTATLSIDVCSRDRYRNGNAVGHSRRKRGSREAVEVVHVDVDLPRLRIDSQMIDSSIVVVPGQNATVDLTLEMAPWTFVTISGVFHNRTGKRMVKERYTLELTGQNDTVIERSDEESSVASEVIAVTVLSNSSRNDTSEEKAQNGTRSTAQNGKTQVPIRVNLNTESGELTGKLYIEAISFPGTEEESPLVKRVSISHVIRIRRINKQRVFPRRRIFIEKRSKFECNENNGRNCTLSCGAVGRSLSTIAIVKQVGNATVHREMSYRTNDRIFTMVDVGKASPANGGNYFCAVTDSKGGRHRTRLILTSGFPRIDVNKTRLVDLGNDMSLITCAVVGNAPMVVSAKVSLPSSQERIDDVDNSLRTETKTGNGLVMTFEVPTDVLRYPAYSLTCLVSSEFGNASYSIFLPDIVKANKTLRPRIIQERSTINVMGNATATITCAAELATRIKATVSYGRSTSSISLDDLAYETKIAIFEEKIPAVSWFIDNIKSMIERHARFYCVATNKHGIDYYKMAVPTIGVLKGQ